MQSGWDFFAINFLSFAILTARGRMNFYYAQDLRIPDFCSTDRAVMIALLLQDYAGSSFNQKSFFFKTL